MRPVVLTLALPLAAAVPHGHHHDNAMLSRLRRWTPLEAAEIPPPHTETKVTRHMSKDDDGNDVVEEVTTKTTTSYTYGPAQPDEPVPPAQLEEQPQSEPVDVAGEHDEATGVDPADAGPPAMAAPPTPAQAETPAPAAASEPPSTGSGDGSTSPGGAGRKQWVDDMVRMLPKDADKKYRDHLHLFLANTFRAFFNDGRSELQPSDAAAEAAQHWASQCSYTHGDTTWKGVSLGQNIAYYPTADVTRAGADASLVAMLQCFYGWFHDEESLWDYQRNTTHPDASQRWTEAGFAHEGKTHHEMVIHLENILNRNYGSTAFAVQHCPSLAVPSGKPADAYFCVANYGLRDGALSAEDSLPAAKPGPFPQPAELAEKFLKGGDSKGRAEKDGQ